MRQRTAVRLAVCKVIERGAKGAGKRFERGFENVMSVAAAHASQREVACEAGGDARPKERRQLGSVPPNPLPASSAPGKVAKGFEGADALAALGRGWREVDCGLSKGLVERAAEN